MEKRHHPIHIHHDGIISTATVIIWLLIAILMVTSIGLGILALIYGNELTNATAAPVYPTGLACNYNVACETALNACMLGDWVPNCSNNFTVAPVESARNCSLIYLDALGNTDDVPPEALQFAQLIEVNNNSTRSAGPVPGMTNAQMQTAVAWWCDLVFRYVKCSCNGCGVCNEQQDVCLISSAPFWCTLHMKMGFSDALIYNGTTPYFNYNFMSGNTLAEQEMIVSSTYRVGAPVPHHTDRPTDIGTVAHTDPFGSVILYSNKVPISGNLGNRTTTTNYCNGLIQKPTGCATTPMLISYTGDDLAGLPGNFGFDPQAIVFSVNGQIIANKWIDMFTGSGNVLLQRMGSTGGGIVNGDYWTGTTALGAKDTNCLDWSSSLGTGRTGDDGSLTSTWVTSTSVIGSSSRQIICVCVI